MSPAPENPRAIIGGNNPPELELLAEAHSGLLEEIGEVVAAANAITEVKSDAEDGAAAAVGLDLRALTDATEAAMEKAKRPHLDANKAINDFFKPSFTALNTALVKLRATVARYKATKAAAETARQAVIAEGARKEAERFRALAAERAAEGAPTTVEDIVAAGMDRRAVDAEAAAAAPLAGTGRVVDKATGAKSQGRQEWAHAIENPGLIPLDALRDYFDLATIEKAVGKFVLAGGRELKGVRIYQKTTVQFRR